MKIFKKIIISFLLVFTAILPLVGYYLYKQDFSTQIELGSPAPEFDVTMISGEVFNLKVASDTSIVYLSFLRFSSCPICNYRVHELIENVDSFRLNNILPILVFESTREDLTKYADFYDIPIDMIADPENKLYDLYEVEENMVKLMINSQTDEVSTQLEEGTALFYDDIPRDADANLARLPADFVISKGKFALSNYGRHVGDNTPINDICKLAKGLK